MNTETSRLAISGLTIEVVRKAIKHLHLGVYPPQGRVRVAVPLAVSDDAVRLAVIDKLGWIRRQQERFKAQPRQSPRDMVRGESHYYLGQRYRLRVLEHHGASQVALGGKSFLMLYVRPGATPEARERLLQRWYRAELKARIPPLLARWEPALGVQVAAWGVKKMKTKWGSCNINARRVWFNLELIKKPIACLEYIVVHELAHLVERHHNDRFLALMDQHLPRWRGLRDELNQAPLAHEDWRY